MTRLQEKKAHAVTSTQGFTLIELMVVMVILGILAGLIVPRIMDRPEEARRTKAGIQIRSLEQALKLYKLDNGQYPTTEQGLQALVEAPTVGALARKWRTPCERASFVRGAILSASSGLTARGPDNARETFRRSASSSC